jgi:hypothetical protein
MCFSTTASCIAGAALVAVGARTLQLSRGRAEVPLGLVPMLFGVQQLTEGLVWYGLNTGRPRLTATAAHLFLVMASSHQAIRTFGVLAFALAAVAYLVKAQAFVSVWCLFAAVLSLALYAYFAGPDRGEWSTMADEIDDADRIEHR